MQQMIGRTMASGIASRRGRRALPKAGVAIRQAVPAVGIGKPPIKLCSVGW